MPLFLKKFSSNWILEGAVVEEIRNVRRVSIKQCMDRRTSRMPCVQEAEV